MTTGRSAEDILALLREKGLPLAGTCSGRVDPVHAEALERWLERGLQGPLAYMSRWREQRADPSRLEPWVKGVFVAALPYHTRRDASARAIASGRGWISRYAWGRDYHRVLRARLAPAVRALEDGGFKARACVDTAPLLERHFAWKAGLGFIGKNGMLIHPEFGSYVFLGAILTDMALEDGPALPDGCGECSACLVRCPAGALVAPRLLDAGRCLSTWTIEARGPFPEDVPGLKGHLFGCDRCQEVCPFNAAAPLAAEPDFEPREGWFAPVPAEVAALSEAEWDRRTTGMALRRARRDGLVRNARRVLEEQHRAGRPVASPAPGSDE